MAKFVLAGKADCPYFAKVELLADLLQGSLPNFTVHKISIHPNEWEAWLETTCQSNGWKHKKSPLIWRELISRGGKGLLLGGFNDFLEHCQEYYSIVSDMSADTMLKIAAENLETAMILIQEEQHRLSLIQPLHLWISGALNPTCYKLIPHLLSDELFPRVSHISLHLLDLGGEEAAIHGLAMEVQDLALPLLHEVTIHADLEKAFQKANVIILLDEQWPEDSDAGNKGVDKKTGTKDGADLREISARYRHFGQLIGERAHKEAVVIVAGDAYVNLRCSLLLESAGSIDSRHFVAVATQLENEARTQIAKQLRVRTSDVTDVIIWGNVSGRFHVDLQKAKVFKYNGAIKGPQFFSQPVLELLYDSTWLETEFPGLVNSHRAAMSSKSCRGAAMSAANGIFTVLKAWNGVSSGEILSLGVCCQGQFNLPDGIVFSLPVTFKDRRWSPVADVTIDDTRRQELQLSADELKREKELCCC